MEIWCVKGMHRLKLVSYENNSGFKGLKRGKDQGVYTSKTKHVTQSKQNNVSGTYNLPQSIRWQCTIPASLSLVSPR